jgi:hypothetical protein
MKKMIIILLSGMFAVLAGCISATTPTPQPVNPGEVALTMMSQKIDAEATQMAVNVQFTATAQIVGATATAQAHIDAQATAEQARKDAQATVEQARKDAQATAEQARKDAQATEQQRREDIAATQMVMHDFWTATAQQQAIYNSMTAQVLPTHMIWTQEAVQQQQIIATNKVELSNLEVERQRKSNTLDALWKYAVATAMMIAAVIMVLRYSRVREIKNDETGVIEGLLVDAKHLIRPQLMPGPALDLSGDTVTAPQVVDKETQNEVTRRAQAIEALRAMPTERPTANAALMTNSVFAESKKPVIQVLEAGQVQRKVLDELADQVVEEE